MKKIFYKIFYIFLLFISFSNYLESSRNRKAIVIGIQNYRNYASLLGCHGDVNRMVGLLKKSGFKDDFISTIKDDHHLKMITASDLYTYIINFGKSIEKGDEVVFFFSGHGIGDRSGNNYLLGFDGNINNPSRFSVRLDEIKNILKENKPSEIIMIIDACRTFVERYGRNMGKKHSANFHLPRGVKILEVSDLKRPAVNPLKRPPISEETSNTIVKTIFAAGEGEESFEREDKNSGIFTYYLTYFLEEPTILSNIDIENNGIISIENLLVFAVDRIEDYCRRVGLPLMRPQYHTEGGMLYQPFELFNYDDKKREDSFSSKKDIMEDYILSLSTDKNPLVSIESKAEMWRYFIQKYPRNNEYMNYAISRLRHFEQKIAKKARTIVIELPGQVEIKMILVEAGSFNRNGYTVTLTNDYYIGKYPVTQEQWLAIMNSNPSYYKGMNLPVDSINWFDCKIFIQKLNDYFKNNVDISLMLDSEFRLPTEAEWEFAFRGGIESKGYLFSGSNNINEVAWYKLNSNGRTQPVGLKKPNELGIYDMSGNVYEWCMDYFGEIPNINLTNPVGPDSGSGRVLRGGSWNSEKFSCKLNVRFLNVPETSKFKFFGFRIVISRL